MVHPVLFLIKGFTTAKLAGLILKQGVVRLLMLCQPRLAGVGFLTLVTFKELAGEAVFPVVQGEGGLVSKILVTFLAVKRGY